MPYGGDSDKGLIKLLYEVALPQVKNAAYDLSTPANSLSPAEVQTPIW